MALCCLHDGVLERYLTENPYVKTIILCLDADHWGERAAFRIAQKYGDKGYAIAVTLPPSGKDWSEYLHQKKEKTHFKEQ